MDGRKIADLRVLLVTYRVAPTARSEEALTRELVLVAGELLALADLGRKVRISTQTESGQSGYVGQPSVEVWCSSRPSYSSSSWRR